MENLEIKITRQDVAESYGIDLTDEQWEEIRYGWVFEDSKRIVWETIADYVDSLPK
jgi:hypothetical protein